MQYSSSIRHGILKKVLPPESKSIRSTSKETGICEQTIRNWIKKHKSGSLDSGCGEKGPRNLSNREKYHLLMESAKIPSEKLGEFLRDRGLHSEHLTLWDQELREMVTKKEDRRNKKLKEQNKKIKQLEKELARGRRGQDSIFIYSYPFRNFFLISSASVFNSLFCPVSFSDLMISFSAEC